MIKATVDGPVELYFNDGKKIETTATGAIVSGICTATTFSGTTANITGDLDVDGHTNLDNVSIAGVCTATSFSGDGQNLTNTGSSLSEPTSGTHRIVTTSLTSGTMTSSGTDSVLSFNYSTHTLAATNFSGSGASLTSLAANQLSSGTIPDARFPSTLPAANGSNLTNLNGSNIASGTVPVARIGTGTKNTSTFYRGDGTFATVTAPAITAINNATNNRIVTSEGGTTVNSEINLTFDGTTLAIAQSGVNAINLAGGDIRFQSGGWSGEYAGKIQHHGSWLYIQGGTSGHIFRSGSQNGDSWMIEADNPRRFRPSTDNAFDIGSSSYRVRNIYTADLHCSNRGSKNDIDGTWGDYTMQEGENDLFLINNRSGKKYKFNLTEVN